MGNKFSKIIYWWPVHFRWGEEERILCPHASPFRALEITASVATDSRPPGEQWLLLKAKMEVLFLPLCVILGKSLWALVSSSLKLGMDYLIWRSLSTLKFHDAKIMDEKTFWWRIKQSTDVQPSVNKWHLACLSMDHCRRLHAKTWLFLSKPDHFSPRKAPSIIQQQAGWWVWSGTKEGDGHTPRPFLLPHGWHTSITLGVSSPWATPKPPFLTRDHFISSATIRLCRCLPHQHLPLNIFSSLEARSSTVEDLLSPKPNSSLFFAPTFKPSPVS